MRVEVGTFPTMSRVNITIWVENVRPLERPARSKIIYGTHTCRDYQEQEQKQHRSQRLAHKEHCITDKPILEHWHYIKVFFNDLNYIDTVNTPITGTQPLQLPQET
jgi:hypothetical protein